MAVDEQVLYSVKNVKKHFPIKGGLLQRVKSHVKAVDGITLDIYKGETLGVVGESGCGKSTLGRTILGLESLTEGELVFNGNNISKHSARQLKPFKKEMQMIFQDPYASLNPKQRIGDALEEALIIHTKLSAQERREKVIQLLNEVGLKEEHYDRYPHEFSGGQRQRIGIARAISINPSFIVCDEPVSALDVSVQAQVIKLLKDLQEKHALTYLFVSHDLGVVRHLCNRVLVMYLGQMVELAPVEKLYDNPTHPYTEALLSAIPRPAVGRKRERIRLTGDLPSPSNPPTGCPFHTRCPIAKEHCAIEKPAWREIDEGHFIACHER
ncbi:ABC transporter ATP-binding protein [Fictibacillus phosphorivorans]|uniref:ABC transporter ATP-binding protein n=1 Tax=Fictibacillus phosphorivorans TaxID=1221500 RepID=UPI00203E0808|nr:dipeptide ABC transporter ATP-binding protein [Fictibacillus phosphorivorans]MCM3717600.1 dipeptide ABC transporter ATP-binding protein [Fictibacillus phosphorivorans]MCM3775500.1 dipeptide ABC transporter ATP-binding protein [Fictibacillus phosphorivorans]